MPIHQFLQNNLFWLSSSLRATSFECLGSEHVAIKYGARAATPPNYWWKRRWWWGVGSLVFGLDQPTARSVTRSVASAGYGQADAYLSVMLYVLLILLVASCAILRYAYCWS